jgi:hypothetical protein
MNFAASPPRAAIPSVGASVHSYRYRLLRLPISGSAGKLWHGFTGFGDRLRRVRIEDLLREVDHEYPGKAGLFWVRHEHILR